MQAYEAENIALSAAVICAAEGVPPARAQVTAGTAALTGRLDQSAFSKKCAKYPLYAAVLSYLGNETSDDCSVDGLCALHRSLFSAKSDAGELRTTPLERTGGAHADPRILRGSLKNVLTKLSQLSSAPQIAKADFAALLAGYDRELIILSPFAYGNAVVRRAFLVRFCRAHGFRLSLASANKTELTDAEDAAFLGDDPQPIFSLLVKCLGYGQEERKKAPALPSVRRRERRKKEAEDESPALKNGVYHEKRPIGKTGDVAALKAELSRMASELRTLSDQMDALQKKLDALSDPRK